jgi:hypothetical protein
VILEATGKLPVVTIKNGSKHSQIFPVVRKIFWSTVFLGIIYVRFTWNYTACNQVLKTKRSWGCHCFCTYPLCVNLSQCAVYEAYDANDIVLTQKIMCTHSPLDELGHFILSLEVPFLSAQALPSWPRNQN